MNTPILTVAPGEIFHHPKYPGENFKNNNAFPLRILEFTARGLTIADEPDPFEAIPAGTPCIRFVSDSSGQIIGAVKFAAR